MKDKILTETPTEPPVPTIELGGRVWFLKITHRVLERFSAITRCSLQDLATLVQRYDMMVLLLWLMMAETRPSLTREGLNGWLNDLPLQECVKTVGDAVTAALQYSFPQAEEAADEETDEAEPKNPTEEDI